jgi:hypothetical protein
MDRPDFWGHTDVAWLILGYLWCYPDAKDTVEGIQQWWLGSMRGMHSIKVQRALDDLVKAGWVVSTERRGTGIVYGLNAARRAKLPHFVKGSADLR